MVGATNNYYVAKWGNDNGQGTLQSPWQNVSYATTQVTAGDTIYLISGTWENEIINFLGKNGNSTHPITMTQYNGTVILNNSMIKADSSSITTSYINISNIRLTNSPGQGIYFRKSNNIHISNVEVDNSSLSGVYFVDSVNSSLLNSSIHNNGWNSVMIQSNFMNTSDFLIKNNTIYNNYAHNLVDLFNYGTYSVKNITIVDNEIYYTSNYSAFFPHINTGANQFIENINFSDNYIHDVTNPASSNNVNMDFLKNSIVYNNTIKNSTGGINWVVSTSYTDKQSVDIMHNKISDVNEDFRIRGSYDSYVKLTDNQGDYYRVDNMNFAIIQNPLSYKFDIRTANNGRIILNYTENKVFIENGANTTKYYPERSEYITLGNETVSITTYPMTARPASSPATVTVNSFDTSRPAGSILASFTANTTNNNTVAFTMSTLTPGKRYLVNVSGVTVDYPTADPAGVIRFNYSKWPAGVFTVAETTSNISYAIEGSIEDLTQDGIIDKADLVYITYSIVLYMPCPRCDINNDGAVDVYDLVLVSKKIPG